MSIRQKSKLAVFFLVIIASPLFAWNPDECVGQPDGWFSPPFPCFDPFAPAEACCSGFLNLYVGPADISHTNCGSDPCTTPLLCGSLSSVDIAYGIGIGVGGAIQTDTDFQIICKHVASGGPEPCGTVQFNSGSGKIWRGDCHMREPKYDAVLLTASLEYICNPRNSDLGDFFATCVATSNSPGCTCSAAFPSMFSGSLPLDVQPKPPTGVHQTSTCNSVTGWACDTANLAASITVDMFVDGAGVPTASVVANQVNADPAAVAACGGNTHGFVWTLPPALRNGVSHSIRTFAHNAAPGPGANLSGTPKSTPVGCANDPVGNHTSTDCTQAVGWACDWDSAGGGTAAINVQAYVDGVASGAPFAASINNAGSSPTCNGTLHGFTWAIPLAVKDGLNHVIRMRAINTGGGSDQDLAGTPQNISCVPPPDCVVGEICGHITTNEDNGATGLLNYPVQLRNGTGQVLQSVSTTDNAGTYSFTGLTANSTYYVKPILGRMELAIPPTRPVLPNKYFSNFQVRGVPSVVRVSGPASTVVLLTTFTYSTANSAPPETNAANPLLSSPYESTIESKGSVDLKVPGGVPYSLTCWKPQTNARTVTYERSTNVSVNSGANLTPTQTYTVSCP